MSVFPSALSSAFTGTSREALSAVSSEPRAQRYGWWVQGVPG